jgi:thiol-disulfide isomerase/thioredoxin
MFGHRTAIVHFALLTMLLAVPHKLQSEEADAVNARPRYQFAPGQHLVYKTKGEFRYENGSLDNDETWNVWVIRRDPDGTARLILTKQGHEMQVGYVDLHPDGRYVVNPTLEIRLNPAALFPALGDAQAQAWEQEDRQSNGRIAYQVKSDETSDAEFVFTANRSSIEDAIYQRTWRATYRYDRGQGLIARIETATTQGWGINVKGSTITVLESNETSGGNESKTLAAELEQVALAIEKSQAALRDIDKHPDRCEELIAAAQSVIDSAASQATQPDAKKLIADYQAGNLSAGTLEYYRSSAKEVLDVLNKPAADWETTELGGTPYSLKELQGKVLVLDFWYRGCGWCIKAMPQVKAVAEHFKDRPVAVLGMNTDRDPADAQFVIDQMQISYPTLKAQGLPEKFRVRGFPTLVIVDRCGVVRGFHVGYSSHLAEDVIQAVERLLGE